MGVKRSCEVICVARCGARTDSPKHKSTSSHTTGTRDVRPGMPLNKNAFTRGLMEEQEGYVRVLIAAGESGLSFDEAAEVTAVEKDSPTFLKVAVGWRLLGIESPDQMYHAARGSETSKEDAEKLIGMLNSEAKNKRELLFKRPLDPPLIIDKDGFVTVVAPPGSLGLFFVINDTPGAVVDRIERGSPIAPSVRPGMVFRKIDGEDVSNLTRMEVAAMLKKRAEQRERVLTLAPPYDSPWPMRILVAIGVFAVLFVAFLLGGVILEQKLQERRTRMQTEAEFVVGKLGANENLDLSNDFLLKVALPAMMTR